MMFTEKLKTYKPPTKVIICRNLQLFYLLFSKKTKKTSHLQISGNVSQSEQSDCGRLWLFSTGINVLKKYPKHVKYPNTEDSNQHFDWFSFLPAVTALSRTSAALL